MEVIKNDLAVIGAGFAGVCAAISAARQGLKVALVGNRPVLGGNSSSEIRMWTRGATGGGNLFAEEMGIPGEIKLRNLFVNPEGNVVFWDEVLYDFVNQEKNITLFLNVHITDIEMKDKDIIFAVVGYQQGSEKKYFFESAMFLDSTGDGTVGYLASALYNTGRESKEEYDETLAPKKADSYTLGSTIYFQTKRVISKVKFIPPSYAYSKDEIEKLLNRGGRIVNEKMSGCDYWWLEYGGIKNTIGDNPEIVHELKKIALGVWDYIKNSEKYDADYLTLEWIGNIPGKRESRRFIGDYILNQNDIVDHRLFEDAVCHGGWFLDFHPPEGIYSEEAFCEQIPVDIYNIPMRCLYSKNIGNLIFAGRDISVTHAAFASTRIMNTCALTGQAAGTIAGFCLKHKKNPRQIYHEHIGVLRQELLKDDMFIIGCKNMDPLDKAKSAVIEASSCRKAENARTKDKKQLKNNMFIIIPWLNANEFQVLIDSDSDTKMTMEVYKTRYVGSYRPGKLLTKKEIEINKGINQWIKADLTLADQKGVLYVLLKKNKNIYIHESCESSTGILFCEVNSRKRSNPCIRILPETGLYKPENIINGYNRPYELPNLWASERIAENENEWLMLKWRDTIEINEIRLYFNPDLNKELTNFRGDNWSEHHGFEPKKGMPPELLKDYSIYAFLNGSWQKILEVKDNWKRLAIHQINSIKTDKIKIEFEKTYSHPYIEVFEIRVY